MIARNDRKQAEILGVKIDGTPKKQLLRTLHSNLAIWDKSKVKPQALFITTPNPEQIMRAQKDKEFAKILNSSDIAIPDAVGLMAANKFFKLSNPKNKLLRLPVLIFQGLVVGLAVLTNRTWLEREVKATKGREMFLDIIKLANKKGWRVVLLGDRSQSASKALEKLRQNFLKVRLFPIEGPNLDANTNPTFVEDKKIEKDVVAEINRIKPHILFVGFGAPKQEKWVYCWLQKLDVGVVMVVGGTFDFISGKTKLPPKFIEKIGLEWLYRLFAGGQKLSRVFTATVLFPLRVFYFKLIED
ncbi:WecB/TagA/CpsF family glycosyltransferase [Patescibacteria group bacterium]|nr:WecB/TagA/CpsF family glycosyltransferase [Patescibacteria group bacterium]